MRLEPLVEGVAAALVEDVHAGLIEDISAALVEASAPRWSRTSAPRWVEDVGALVSRGEVTGHARGAAPCARARAFTYQLAMHDRRVAFGHGIEQRHRAGALRVSSARPSGRT